MANLRHNTRYVLDTAEAVLAAGNPIVITGLHYIGTTDDHDCILHDGGGKEIWKCKLGDVSVDGYQKSITFGGDGQTVDGLDLDTIDSGILYVYMGRRK